jgi:hypothetical protein
MDNKAEELKGITRAVLGDRPGQSFYARIELLIDDGSWSNTSLLSATKEIEKAVRLFVGVECARSLQKKYKEFFKKHPAYV